MSKPRQTISQEALSATIERALEPLCKRLEGIASNIDVLRNGWGEYLKTEHYDALKSQISDAVEKTIDHELILLEHRAWNGDGIDSGFEIKSRFSPELNMTTRAMSAGIALEVRLDSIDEQEIIKNPRDLDLAFWGVVEDEKFADYTITDLTTRESFHFRYVGLESSEVEIGGKTVKHTGDWVGVDHPYTTKSPEIEATPDVRPKPSPQPKYTMER